MAHWSVNGTPQKKDDPFEEFALRPLSEDEGQDCQASENPKKRLRKL